MNVLRRDSLRLRFYALFDAEPALQSRIKAIFSGNLQGTAKVASSRYAKVFRFEAEVRGESRVFYYKEFLFRNLRDRISVLFRPSRAARAAAGSLLLIEHGFDTALPVCVGEERRFGIVRRSLLVTEAVPEVIELADYLDQHLLSEGVEGLDRKRSFLKEYGGTIGRLHRAGIFQGDLRERNVLVQSGDPPRFFLVDNERTCRYRVLPDRKRLKNLVQVNMYQPGTIMRTDRVRFFYAYLEENPGLLPCKRKWMGMVLKKTRSRLRGKGRL